MRPHTITTVVFDLDDTLYDCYHQRVQAAHRYASRKLLGARLGRHVRHRLTVDSLSALRLRLFREERNLDTLDRRLIARLKIGGQTGRHLAHIGRNAYFSFPVRRLRLFPDAMPTLRRLHRMGVRIYIITAGHLHIQQAKTRLLGLDRSPYVHAVLYTGLTRGRGKKQRLRSVLRYEPNPRRVLVVGDRPDSEIRAARELGMWTVRRLGGEFAGRRPSKRSERALFTLRRVSRLFSLPFKFSPR